MSTRTTRTARWWLRTRVQGAVALGPGSSCRHWVGGLPARLAVVLLLGFGLTGPCIGALGVVSDPTLPEYQPMRGVSGTISSVGSDTLANVMILWAQTFMRLYPKVTIQIHASGSSTAPIALTQGASDLGPMSRRMNLDELRAFENQYGHSPTPVLVAVDALALYVSQDNPLPGLSLGEIDAIFSSTRRCGASWNIVNWGQLALQGPWARRDIRLLGRNSASGTYGYFKQRALCGGDFKRSVNELPGSASVVRAVAQSVNAIGYAGRGFRGAGVRVLPIVDPSGLYIEATAENVLQGRYPFSRHLYIYVNKVPAMPLPLVQREFFNWVLSRAGQQLLLQGGYVPLPAEMVVQQRRKLQL